MCVTCGCGDEDDVRLTRVGDHPQTRAHGHDHGHAPGHRHPASLLSAGETLELGERVLARNDQLALGIRDRLAARSIVAVNLMSSPGSGKTSLLERTIGELRGRREVVVIEGDQETTYDADRITGAGARAVQVNTGAGCHLDAAMVGGALDVLDPAVGSLLFVENVGNLVCPALFDVGEHAKAVVVSVTEGDDKPLKYPHMFAAADVVVVNKTDLLAHVDFDPEAFGKAARSLNPGLEILQLSVRDGTGMPGWYDWLEALEVPA